MVNPGLPDPLWEVLDQRLWDATSANALRGIVSDGEVWITGNRYENSLCRHLKGVSLFDFGPTAVDDWSQFDNWRGWFGSQQDARVPIWLEIDRRATLNRVYDAGTLHGMWKERRSKMFIPGVEACHLGPIPVSVLKGALLIDRYDLRTFECFERVDETLTGLATKFENSLPPSPLPITLAAKLEAARERHR